LSINLVVEDRIQYKINSIKKFIFWYFSMSFIYVPFVIQSIIIFMEMLVVNNEITSLKRQWSFGMRIFISLLVTSKLFL